MNRYHIVFSEVDDFLDDVLELEPHHREALDDFDYYDFPHVDEYPDF